MTQTVYADRVQETTNTTGTGNYALDGAVAGFQTFASAIGASNTTHYCCTDGTDWEVGYGTLQSDGVTLNRTVLTSSHSDNKVDWGAGSKNIFVVTPAAYHSVFSTGLKPIQAAGNDISDNTGIGVAIGEDHKVSSDAALAVGSGGHVWQPGQLVISNGKFADRGDSQALIDTLAVTTSDDTATYLLPRSIAGDYNELELSELPLDRSAVYSALIIARDTGSGDTHAWRAEWIQAWLDSGPSISQPGTAVVTDLGSHASASSWSISVVSTVSGPRIQVTGAAATAINWSATVTAAMVGG